MVVRWRFDDLVDSSFAVFAVNPNAGGSPARHLNMVTKDTLAPGGKQVVFEGLEDPATIDFSGTILTSAMLDMMTTWFSKRHQVRLTDDLGRTYMIMISKFTPKRVRSSNFWKHTFDVSATIVDWP